MGNAQIHSVIQENYNRDINRKRTNDRGDPNTRRSESVIVIDSDSDGEKDGSTSHRHRNHLYPAPDSHLPQDTHRGHSGSPIAQRITPDARLNSQGGHHHHHHPTGTKPPPLTIVSSSSGRANRTTATVTPFSQSAANSITVTSGISANALAPARTSSFAAALRKLAKQANENDEISPQVSPGSSNRSPSSTPSNKNFHLGPSPLLAPTSTPPVVTIAPTHSVNSRLNSVDSRRDLDRYSVWRSKDSPTIQPRSRPMPSHLPKPEDNRGFQPYRSGEDLRLSSDIRHPHLTYDPAAMAATMAASYPIPPSFIPPTHLPYHAFRPEDQMERYGYLRQPFFPLPSPHLIPHPSLGLIPGLRYPTELAMHMPHLAQGVSYGGLVSSASTAERERVIQDLRERERKMEEVREAEMQQLHRERSNSLSEREERLKDIRRSPPTRDSSHISRMHPHSSRSNSSSSYEHPAASGPISLVKKSEEDKWASHKHTSPTRNESRHEDGRRHEDGHRHTSGHSHKDKHYQRNSHHDSSRADPDKSHIPRLFQPDRRHERDPPKEHSKSRAPPPLVSANHVTSHEYSNHRTPDSYHGSGGGTAPPPMQKAHIAISSDEGQSFSVKKAKMNNTRIPSPLNLQLHPSNKDKSASTNHKTRPVLKPLDMDKPEREFDYHFNRFYRLQSLRADQSRGALEVEGPPVSKLDLEAQRRRELRASGIYVTSESESDSDEEIDAKRERYRRKMKRIATRSRMPVDQSEGKVSFMGEIGLVTRIKKEEIILERIKKRRSQLGETSPVMVKKREDTPPLTLLPAAASITTKQFKKEPDYNRKCEFLHHCHLKLSSNDKKRELESARQYVETYRAQKKRRLSEKTSENGDQETKDPNSVSEESLPPGTPLAVQCGMPTIPVHVPAQVYNSTTQPQQLSSSSHKTPAYTLNNHLLQTVPPLQNGMVHSTSKGMNGETPKDPEGGGLDSRPKSADANKNKKSSQFSIASFLDLSSSGKHVDAQSFAQEFHKSVLRKTQKSLANQKVGATENVRRETFFGDQHSSSHSMSRTYSHPTSSSSFQWPGVDQIAEAYYRHKIDQELETSILKDQMGRLQSSNVELRTRDQKLKHRVTELAETHQSQMRVQEDIQTEIQQLQRCFQSIKKTLSPP